MAHNKVKACVSFFPNFILLYFILWMPLFPTTKRLSTFGTSLSSDVAGPEWRQTQYVMLQLVKFSPLWSLYHTRKKSDRGSECNFVSLVWCCISYTLEQLRFKTPPIHHSRGAFAVKHEDEGGGSALGLVRGPACQVMDIWGVIQSCRDEGRLQSSLEVILLLVPHLSMFCSQCCGGYCKAVLLRHKGAFIVKVFHRLTSTRKGSKEGLKNKGSFTVNNSEVSLLSLNLFRTIKSSVSFRSPAG